MIEKAEVKEKQKYYFDLCIMCNFDSKKLSELANKLNITTKEMLKNAQEYYEQYSTAEEKKEYENKKTLIKKPKEQKMSQEQIEMFEKVLNSSTSQEYIDEYKKSKLGVKKIKRLISQYIKELKNKTNITEQQEKEITNILNITIEKYIDYLNEQKIAKAKAKKEEKQKLLPQAETVVAMLIESDNFNYEYIFENYKITKEQLKNYIEIVKENNQDLYTEYVKRIKKINREKYLVKVSKIKEICRILTEEFEENKEERFTILDYYMITKVPLDEMLKIAEHECTKEEFYLFKLFYQDNNNLSKMNIKKILELGNEDAKVKQAIIVYMKEKKLPMIEKIYYILLDKYNQNQLQIKIK